MVSNTYGCALSAAERLAASGKLYRYGTGIVTLSGTGDYVSLCFRTPPTGHTLYAFSTVEKSGNEVSITLVEGCTYSGGTTYSGWNINRRFKDIPEQITNIRRGISVGAGALTISGGLSAPRRFLPGSSTPAGKPGGMEESAGFIDLLEDTNYALKLTSLNGEVMVNAFTEIAVTPERNGHP